MDRIDQVLCSTAGCRVSESRGHNRAETTLPIGEGHNGGVYRNYLTIRFWMFSWDQQSYQLTFLTLQSEIAPDLPGQVLLSF